MRKMNLIHEHESSDVNATENTLAYDSVLVSHSFITFTLTSHENVGPDDGNCKVIKIIILVKKRGLLGPRHTLILFHGNVQFYDLAILLLALTVVSCFI